MSDKHAMELDASGFPGFVVNAATAMTYVTRPEIWPEFIAWLATEHPSTIPARFDSDYMRHVTMLNIAEMLNHFGGVRGR